MKKKVIVLIVILLLCAALLVWCLWANTALTSTVIDVQAGEGLPEEFEGFRIAHISDLHKGGGAGHHRRHGRPDRFTPHGCGRSRRLHSVGGGDSAGVLRYGQPRGQAGF